VFPVRRLKDAIARFPGKRIAVVGDLIADEYLYGKPARISREAPVLILRFTDREVRLGGAANAAHNVHALGATVLPVGLLGQDGAGDEVHALFHQAGMNTDGISRETGRLTPMKTRIMAGGYESTRQQVVRLDREPEGGISGAAETRLIERLEAVGANADGFLVSDYGYGTVTPRVYETVLDLGRARQVPVTVDSRYALPRFKGATAATQRAGGGGAHRRGARRRAVHREGGARGARAARRAAAPRHPGQPRDGPLRARRPGHVHADPRQR